MMRTLAFAGLCTVFLIAVHSCRAGGGAVMDIVTSENTEADLGAVMEEDGPVQANLLIANVYADTLTPLAVYTRCQCISASVDRTPVPPGETLRVQVMYNPAYRSGIFMEEISVKLLGRSSLSLIVKGEVIPAEHPLEEDYPYDFGEGLHLSHEVLHYGRLAPGESRDIFIRYANGSRRDMDIDFSADTALSGSIASRHGNRLGTGERDTLHFRFTMPGHAHAGDTLALPVYVSVDGRRLDRSLTIKAISVEHK
ncbi:MAG: DUF1573 domain-containing protein [Bacteroidales bacterium]|nr:DUF1573 domain-containing protein [Bacteroidales bacterium]